MSAGNKDFPIEETTGYIDWQNFDIDQLPEDLIQKMVDLDKEAPKMQDLDNVVLDPWIFTEQKEKNEIVELDMPMRRWDLKLDSNKMPLPHYFADLYNEFEELRRFDLQEVIYDRKM